MAEANRMVMEEGTQNGSESEESDSSELVPPSTGPGDEAATESGSSIVPFSTEFDPSETDLAKFLCHRGETEHEYNLRRKKRNEYVNLCFHTSEVYL